MIRAVAGLAAAAGASLALLFAAYGRSPTVRVRPSRQDTLVFRDFHKLKASGGRTLRWSRATNAPRRPGRKGRRLEGPSRIRLPQIGRPPAGRLELETRVPRGRGPVALELSVNGAPPITEVAGARLTISLDVPRADLAGGDLDVMLRGPAWDAEPTRSARGVGIEGLTWRPLGRVSPPVRQLILVPLLAVLVGLWLLRLGGSVLVSSLVAVAAGAVVALTAGLRPLLVAPYTHRLVFAMILAHLVLGVWCAILEGRRSLRLPSRVGADGLLILMGAAYWAMLVFQWALAAETGPTVRPTRPALYIGSAVLGALLLAALGAGRGLALWAVAAGSVAQGVRAAAFAFRRPGLDFGILWRAARGFLRGRPLYDLRAIFENPFGDTFKVPPFYGMLLVPLASLGQRKALFAHRVIDVVLYLLVAFLLARHLRGPLGPALAVAAVATVMGLMQPPFDTLAYGQIDIVLLFALALALLGIQRARPALAGFGVAFATLLKVYPLMLAGFFLGRRDWRALGWTAVWLLALNAASVAALGWQPLAIYATLVLPSIGGGTSWVENQTFHGFLSRLATGWLASVPTEDPFVNAATYGVCAVVSGASILLAARRVPEGSSVQALQAAAFVVAMVLVSPAAWMHYQTLTVLAFVALVWNAGETPWSARKAVLLAAAFALVAYGNQWSFFDGQRAPGLPALALSYKFYGLVVLWSVVAATVWTAGSSTREPGRP